MPSQQTAIIRLGKRLGGKMVTLVEGLDPSASDLEELLQRLKTTCAAGGALRNGIVEIQGDHRTIITESLASEGYQTRTR